MEESIETLCKKFIEIRKMGYVKAINNNLNGGGLTFEKLVGATAESFEYPDFEGIEIKTRRSYSKYAIGLFNANPDGEYLFEVERLKNTYGYPDKRNKEFKVFNANISASEIRAVGWSTKYKLKVDYKKNKIFLCIYDQYDYLIEEEVSWSFEMLKEKLYRKMEFLAIVNCWDTNRNENLYYKYYKMEIFKLKNFETFLKLIEKGIIEVLFTIGIFHSGKRFGQTYNHGVRFIIKYENIELLYTKLKSI